jgi:hypothetical protein
VKRFWVKRIGAPTLAIVAALAVVVLCLGIYMLRLPDLTSKFIGFSFFAGFIYLVKELRRFRNLRGIELGPGQLSVLYAKRAPVVFPLPGAVQEFQVIPRHRVKRFVLHNGRDKFVLSPDMFLEERDLWRSFYDHLPEEKRLALKFDITAV